MDFCVPKHCVKPILDVLRAPEDPDDEQRFFHAIQHVKEVGKKTIAALSNVYADRRFGRWCDAGVFEKLHEYFHAAGEISAVLIDSTIVRAHTSAVGAPKKNGGQATEALGRSHGGFTTKLHSAVSKTFLPLRFILTAGGLHDVTQVPALIAGYAPTYVIADTAYDSDPLRAEILAQDRIPVIRSRKNRV